MHTCPGSLTPAKTAWGPSLVDPERRNRWYAILCQPHRERAASRHLANQGFAVFLPLRRKTRRHARRVETVKVPFFAGYAFVRFDISRDRWRSINGTIGVARLVMQGDKPAAAPPGVVEALQDACGDDGVMPWRPDLAPGESVRICNGPFAEFIGELDRMTDQGRLRVLLNIMGANTPVSLSREDVIPADSSW